ncbi:hypothetical protein AB0B63_23310 [Micromonospora sp. NPDC049081]|uniref:hypothetical protein n=1 Tax=Micromonospora sp. NPDC049081 TaxID=3155150 RepID=UPI0033D9F6E0
MFVEDNINRRQERMLCDLRATNPITPTVRLSPVQLSGFITDEQIRVVGQLRGGEDLWLNLQLNTSSVEWPADSIPKPGATPPFISNVPVAALEEITARVKDRSTPLPPSDSVAFERPLDKQLTRKLGFGINAGEWTAQLMNVQAGAFVELLVPLARGADYTDAVKALREALELLRQGSIEARKAVEQVRAANETQRLFNAGKTKSPREQTYDERWAFMVEDLFSTMSAAGHKGEVTKDFEFTREDGEMLIVATAGMLKRLSADSTV